MYLGGLATGDDALSKHLKSRIETGEVVWKVETQDVVSGRALVTGQTIYFGSDDGKLYALE